MTATDLQVLVLAGVLVVVAGILVAVETAIGRLSRVRAEQLSAEGVRGADRLVAVLTDRARYVNVLLFLSTVATVTAIALVTVVATHWLTGLGWTLTWAVLAAVAVMVVVSYVVLGVAARTLGDQHAERIALRGAGPARALATILGPLASLLILVGNAVTPGRGYREGPFVTRAELLEMLDRPEAAIEADERAMIRSVFDLGRTVVRGVMVPRTEMVTVTRTVPVREAMQRSIGSGHSRIPVIGDTVDDVVGVVYLKDVVRRVLEDPAADGLPVDQAMRPAYFVPDSKASDDLLREMQAARVHLAVVVDEYGGTAGVVSIEDLLEEIVGDITDEYDTEVPEVVPLPGGAFRLSARMHVDDFGELAGVPLDGEQEGVDTLMGLLARRLGRVPSPGAEVDIEGWRLVAEQAEGRRNRIATLLATPPDTGSPDG